MADIDETATDEIPLFVTGTKRALYNLNDVRSELEARGFPSDDLSPQELPGVDVMSPWGVVTGSLCVAQADLILRAGERPCTVCGVVLSCREAAQGDLCDDCAGVF